MTWKQILEEKAPFKYFQMRVMNDAVNTATLYNFH